MPTRPLEEDPEWSLFLPFDSLEFSFVGGSIGVTRPIPEEVSARSVGGGTSATSEQSVESHTLPPSQPPTRLAKFYEIAQPTLEMVLPVIERVTKVRRVVLGQSKRKPEVLFVDRPLAEKPAALQATSSPVDDLRLADQMVRLALVGKPRSYSYWFFQFFVASDVNRVLGRGGDSGAEDGERAGAVVENDMILHKIENMTGTRILVAPYDSASWRRCFMLLGEEELITRALTLLSGAIAQGMAPTRENVRQMMATLRHGDDNVHGVYDDPLLERDARLEEIREELLETYKLRMVEMLVRTIGLSKSASVWKGGEGLPFALTRANPPTYTHKPTPFFFLAGRELPVPRAGALRVQDGGAAP